MAPNKKKKKAKGTTSSSSSAASSSPHNKQPRKLSIAELMQAAEHAATTMMDIKNAITLYTIALQKLLVMIQPDDDTLITERHANENDTTTGTTTSTIATTTTTTSSSSPTAMILEIYEKRAELYIEIQHTDLALQDYQEILQYLQQHTMISPPTPTVIDSTFTTTSMEMTTITNLVRQATIHMSMGQLSNSDMALQSYQKGKQCLRTALTMIPYIESTPTASVTTTTTVNTMPSSLQPLQDEIQQQYCRACCCIAELYLTDLCYSDDAEQCCEESLQESLSIINASSTSSSPNNNNNNKIHCIETYQMIASLRFSQKRNTEAHEYMKRVYEPISVGCQALAVLVGLRTTKSDHDDTDTTDDTTDHHNPMAIELIALEHVQSLPPIEFRISTSKLLLECAGTLPYADPNVSTINDTENNHNQNSNTDIDRVVNVDDVRNYNATQEQQEYAIKAMDVIGSCLAEHDEMYECWILLGDAMIFLEKESALSYWNRAVQILLPIQQQLQKELLDNDHPIIVTQKRDNGMNDNEYDENEDPIQQQFDTIVMEMDQLQDRMDWAVRSGYEDGSTGNTTTNNKMMVTNTTDGMEE